MQIICERSNEKGRKGERTRGYAPFSRAQVTECVYKADYRQTRHLLPGPRSRQEEPQSSPRPGLSTADPERRAERRGRPKDSQRASELPAGHVSANTKAGEFGREPAESGRLTGRRARGLRLTPPTTTAGDQTNGRPRALHVGALRAHAPAAASPSRFAPAALQTPRPSCSSQKAKEIHYSRTLTRHNLKKLGRYS